MFLLGHIGIMLGASALLTNALSGSCFSRVTRNEVTESSSHSSQVTTTRGEPLGNKLSWFASLGTRIDIRLLLIGSMLPDIIDKTIGVFPLGRNSIMAVYFNKD